MSSDSGILINKCVYGFIIYSFEFCSFEQEMFLAEYVLDQLIVQKGRLGSFGTLF